MYCNVVAVTAEKKVATVDRLRRLVAPCFWANRIVGTPKFVEKNKLSNINVTNPKQGEPISMNTKREEVIDSMCSPISDTRS